MDDIKLADGVILKPIPIAPNNDYMAGSDGQIYSNFKYKGFGKKIYVDWYPLRSYPDKKGWYRHITLSHENVRITKSVHRLVCMAFHGMPPFPSAQVRHLDSNNQNSKPENLCWGTRAENWADRNTNKQRNEGEENSNSKLSDFERSALRWAINKGLCSQRQAARVMGMSQASMKRIAHSKIDWGFGNG